MRAFVVWYRIMKSTNVHTLQKHLKQIALVLLFLDSFFFKEFSNDFFNDLC